MDLGPILDGETPLDDISGLKQKRITTRMALNNAEAENIRRATVKYLAARPSRRVARYDLSWSKALHREMFGKVWKWAGQIRAIDLNIGVPWYQCETALQELMLDLAVWKMDLIEQAVQLHHRAVYIHPFLNGNGRWARMLSNIWLKLHNQTVVRWPEETIGTESVARQDYLRAIRAADNGNYAPLKELHLKHSRNL